MADIFLSYAREDQTRVGPLVAALEGQGWSVFWDRRIPAGQTWRSHIGQALDAARCVIVAWSRDSVVSDWVIEEADVARRRGVLVPILLDPVEPPLGLRALQAADLSGWDADPAAPRFQQLLDDIRAVLSTAPPIAPPPLRMGEDAPPHAAPPAGDHASPGKPRESRAPAAASAPGRAPRTPRWRYALALVGLLAVLAAGYFGYRAYTGLQAERLAQAVRLEIIRAEDAIRGARFDEAEAALRAAAKIDPTGPAGPRLDELRHELAAAREASERVGRLLDEARRALDAEDAAAAEHALAAAARIDPDAPELGALRRELGVLEAALRPDLRVLASSLEPPEPVAGQSVKLAATIANSGRTAAPDALVVWRERATGSLIASSRVGSLEPGQRRLLSFTSTELAGRPGTVETVLEIDPEGAIEELDRGNNVQPVAVRIRSAPGRPPGGATRTISFRGERASRILSGSEYRDAGIRTIRAAPSGDYCARAAPALLDEGSYRAPVSFLSTAEPDQLTRCNSVPLTFHLTRPARAVTVHFYGAATDYWLTGYDAGERPVVRQAAQGEPYVYGEPYRVRIATDAADISAFEFGHQAALTMIVSIELEY